MILSYTATTLSDAWFRNIYALVDDHFGNVEDYTYKTDINSGSFEKEQTRIQFDGLAVEIINPSIDMVPIMPEGSTLDPPSSMEYINNYFNDYIMNNILQPNETYTYGQRIQFPMPNGGTQLDRIIEMLNKGSLTNQAVISVSAPDDLDLCIGNDGKMDPPCLRQIDFKARPDGELTINTYWRSWDLWAGFPTNLGGMELLKQYVCAMTGLRNGRMYIYSAGAHIYGYQEEIVKIRTMRYL